MGAGFAGLAAAKRLTEAGVEVQVLEARERVGGRVLTDRRLVPGVPLELGAQMVHGRTAVTHDWLRRAGLSVGPLRVHQRSRIVLGRRVGRFPWFGLPFHPAVGVRATWRGFRTIPRALARYDGEDRTLRQVLDDWSASPAARALVDVLHAHTYATDPDSIGVVGPAEEERAAEEPFGFRNFRVVEGYSALAERAAAALGGRLRTNAPVTDIVLGRDDVRVCIEAAADASAAEVCARYVVVTVPLGVLKEGTIRFDPPLPPDKLAAIQRLGFGDAYALQLVVRGGTMRRRLGDFGILWGDTATSFHRPRVGLGGRRGRDGLHRRTRGPSSLCARRRRDGRGDRRGMGGGRPPRSDPRNGRGLRGPPMDRRPVDPRRLLVLPARQWTGGPTHSGRPGRPTDLLCRGGDRYHRTVGDGRRGDRERRTRRRGAARGAPQSTPG